MDKTCSALARIALIAWPALAAGATLHVPSSRFPTLHAGLDGAGVGDTVLVAPGTYSDMDVRTPFGTVAGLGFITKPLVLRSEGGAQVTTLDMSAGLGLSSFVAGIFVTSSSAAGVRIDGFRVTGAPHPPILTTGIQTFFSPNVTIENCILDVDAIPPDPTVRLTGVDLSASDGNAVRYCTVTGWGTGVVQSGTAAHSATVENCVFKDCQDGAVVLSFESTNYLRDCFFEGNFTPIGAAGVSDLRGTIDRCVFIGHEGLMGALACGASTVRDCVFIDNLATGSGAAVAASSASTIENCTFVGNVGLGSYSGSSIWAHPCCPIYVRNNVITHSSGNPALYYIAGFGGSITSSCNVFWGNEDGDWSEDFTPSSSDLVVDPEFCDKDSGDFTVNVTSPCLPPNSPGCSLIGAFGQGCGSVGLDPLSWGRLKSMYRDASEEAKTGGDR